MNGTSRIKLNVLNTNELLESVHMYSQLPFSFHWSKELQISVSLLDDEMTRQNGFPATAIAVPTRNLESHNRIRDQIQRVSQNLQKILSYWISTRWSFNFRLSEYIKGLG